ncbi:Fic family protein [Longimicrobium sp.]|uniref:Fic family protein n=1 Tax=Longimicrobium sp. TaxID=2029185 RepID=UPI002E316AF9|nr:Fic/DOC family N-terminal domain-containing protein [Longimicrobium sp.]HEX6036944.1 Fic/DOC family N-terminal domain-containing protein [Longimicrobium sp.]
MPPVKYHAGNFPPRDIRWEVLIPLLGPSAAAVARYDGMLAAIPNADVLLSPLTTQEAVLSSRIEGTQATMGEVLGFEAGQGAASPARQEDIHEILNYRSAMREAEALLRTLPLSLRVVRAAHRVLMSGVRGGLSAPGEYRQVPNWIGPPGCSMEAARFVPIDAAGLPRAMGEWERFAHEPMPDQLVKLAVLHAEFEALHPFLDGNGRIGRMLVPLFMWQEGLIRRPMFYISAYFEARREEYYARLLGVSESNDWTSWCVFFLEAVQAQAEQNLEKAQGMFRLYEEMKVAFADATRSQYAIRALDWIFAHPIFRTSVFVQGSGIPAATATRFVRVLRENGILREAVPASGRRAGLLVFPSLLNLAEGKVVF